jgi:uncharacterized protein (UPF0210 family)
MIRSDQILKTVEMIQKEHLDVRAVTMGISLLDCRTGEVASTAQNIEDKIRRLAGTFVATCDRIGIKYGVAVVNKRISVTPVAHIGAGFTREGFVQLAQALDRAATEVGIDIIGGFSANVEKGIGSGDASLLDAVPEALSSTSRVCSSINAGSTRHGLNMDAVAKLGRTVRDLAFATADNHGFGAAKFVVFANQPGDNPFMAGAMHGLGEADAVINVGVSGPGVIARALERKINAVGADNLGLDDLAEEIKQATFRVTRCGELIGRQVANALDLPFGVVDLSLAPTPSVGDSVGEILKILGVDEIGAPGSTAIVALLNDAVKKGGSFASQSVGGLSGAFIPVMEDSELAAAVESGCLVLEKLEAMTCVCSVGLDMVPVPGDTDAETLAAIMADELMIGVINSKTTAARLIPVPGKAAGEFVSFGGLFGESVIMKVRNAGKSARFVRFGGRIPAPIHSLKN